MNSRTMPLVRRVFLSWALLVIPGTAPQMPAQPGKLEISSTTPGLKISLNGKQRPEVTPVVLVVSPGTYSVVVGPCQFPSVQVSSGETKAVNCQQ
jgi:hypothetical protein